MFCFAVFCASRDSLDGVVYVMVLAVSLQMKVTGKNLLNVCKLLFALAKNEANDGVFLDEQISGWFIQCSYLAI